MKKQCKNTTGELQYRRKPLITAFESRILLDGAAVATMADAMTDVDVQDQADVGDENSSNDVESLSPVADANQNNTQPLEVAFVDTQIGDYQSLIDSLDDGVEVHLIDSGVDGLDAMVSMLHDQTDIDTLHIYSHGEVAELTLGSTTLSLDNLEDNASQLQSLGESLSEDGDILLYGCSVGANDEGRAFVDRIAELSGADVAASDDLTGAAEMGGDWDLEVVSGSIESEVMAATDYSAVLIPSVSNLDASLNITEGDAAVIIDGDVTLTGGIDYTEGTIRFALSSANVGDQFVLTSAADVNANGAISVLAGDVYLGNGAGRDRIGSIDATENGTNGQDLLIHFATPLTNSGFETGDLTGWTIYNSQYNAVNLDGVTTNYYYNSGAITGNNSTVHVADAFSGSYSGQNQSGIVSTGSWALNLTSSGTITFNNQATTLDGSYVVSGYGSWFGPYAVSDPFDVQVGDQLTLDWSAVGGSDSYDVFGYLVDLGADNTYGTGDDSRTLLFSERGATRAWTTTSVSINSAGSYAFEFIGGTYDQTGGKAVGASLYIDNVRLISATQVNDSVATSIARQVTYQNTATDSPPSRTLTITAVDALGGTGSDTMAVNITQANNSPTFSGGGTLGAVNEDTVSPGGSTVSALFTTQFVDPDEAYTPADTLSGIVVTADASSSAQGEWQYSTNGGANWYAVGTVSTDSGLMLSSSSLLRFVPSADYNGTPGALNVYAVDSSNGSAFTSDATRETYDTTTDGAGDAVSAASVTLSTSITSVNDAPVATATAPSATLVEAGGVANATAGVGTSTVTVSMSDIDGTASFDAAGLTSNGWSTANGGVTYTTAGNYGTATLTVATGLVSYQLDESNVDVQALLPADNLNDSITVYIRDNEAATDSVNVVFNIQGANDTPVAGDAGGSAVESGGTANATPGSDATGNIIASITDVDSVANGETRSIVGIRSGAEGGSGTAGSIGVALAGQYGSLTLNADGSYTYVVDEANAAVQALRVTGQQITDSFTYTVADAGGLQDQATFTVTIDGRNDAPVAADLASTAIETGDQASGVDATGNVVTGSADVDSVANGETMTVVALRTGAASGSGTAGSLGVALVGQYGSLTLNADGSYSYVVDDTNPAVEALRTSSDILSEDFAYTVSDAEGLQSQATLTINIQGSNDTPVAGSVGSSAVEAGGIANSIPGSNATGNALENTTDQDVGEIMSVVGVSNGRTSGTVGQPLAGLYGSLTVNADGSYVYVVDDDNAAVQALRASGDTLTDNFTFTASDAGGLVDQSTLSITIDGRNDAPVGTVSAASATLVEDGGALNGTTGTDTSTMTITLSDVDGTPAFDTAALVSDGWSSDDSGRSYTKTGTYGSATLTIATGVVAYQLDNSDADTQALVLNNSVTDSFTLHLLDDQGASSTVNAAFDIQGSNDNPVAPDNSGNATEAGGLSNATPGTNATGNVLSNVTDVDSSVNGEIHSVVGLRTGSENGSGTTGSLGVALAGEYGSLTLNADGTYSYAVDENNAAVQALRTTGQQLTDSFTYTVTDASGLQDQATLNVIIDGRNDAPVSTGALLDSWVYGSAEVRDFSVLFNDVDSAANGEDLTFTISGLPSGLSYDADTGVVSGEPRNVGQFTLTLTARDVAGTEITQTVVLEIESDGTTAPTESTDAPPDSSTPTPDNTPPQIDATDEVGVGSTDLPDGLVDNGAGDQGSAFLSGTQGGEGSSDSGQGGQGAPDSGQGSQGSSEPGPSGGTGSDIMESAPSEGDTGNGEEAANSSPVNEQGDEGGSGAVGEDIIIMSEPGAIVFESSDADGNRSVRAVVDVNVGVDGVVQFSEAQSDAFDIVSLSLSSIQYEEASIQFTIADSDVDRVLLYTGSLGDGSPLPNWIQLDSSNGRLSINPPDDVQDLVVRVKAIDSDGKIRILELQLDMDELRKHLGETQTDPDAPADAFVPLSEQLHAQQTLGYGEQLAMLLEG